MIQARLGSQTDIDGVLRLQERYLFRNLNETEREQGFVTTPFTVSQIEDIILQNGLFIAIDEHNSIVAYAFAGPWTYFKQWEIFNVMIARFPELSFNSQAITLENSFQYGPVCIDENYRGKGILNLIFEAMRIAFVKSFPISITFINSANVISEKAHTRKLGWEIIDHFEFNSNTYIGLAFDMKNSVLNRL